MIRLGLLCSPDPSLVAAHGLYFAELVHVLARYHIQLVYHDEPRGLVERARYYAEFYRLPYEGHATHSDAPMRTHEVMYASARECRFGFLDACDAFLVLVGGVATVHDLTHVLDDAVRARPVCVLDPSDVYVSLRDFLATLYQHRLCTLPRVEWVHSVDEFARWLTSIASTRATRSIPAPRP